MVERDIAPGVILGERALILDTRADESVRVERRARVLQIRKVMFRRLLQEYPEIAGALRSRLRATSSSSRAASTRWEGGSTPPSSSGLPN